MKKTLLSTFALLLIVLGSSAQSTVGKKLIMKPIYYATPDGPTASDKDKKMDAQLNNIWLVFSDREKNPTYASSDGKVRLKELNFMEPYYVTEDVGNYIHILKFMPYSKDLYTEKNKEYILQKNLEDYGWVAKDKMLLWNKCLVDPTTKFTIKALTVAQPSMLDNLAKFAKGKNLLLYNTPEVSTAKQNDKDMRMFEFLFIMKTAKIGTDTAYLIATTDVIFPSNANNAKSKVLGWLPNKAVVVWKDRVTLETNTDDAAVKERESQSIKRCIFKDINAATSYKKSGIAEMEKRYPYDDKFATDRDEPTKKRLPFFTSVVGDVVKTGYQTDVFNLNGDVVIKADDQIKIEKEYNLRRLEFKKVNLIFVVDGSGILKDYQLDIKNIVANTANKMNDLEQSLNGDEATRVDYKLGAVVYRDYVEKDCSADISDVTIKKLTSNHRDVASFFDEIKFADCKDKDAYQAMYLGLMKALSLLDNAKNQSNVIVLIGAGANSDKDKLYKKDDVVKKLIDNNAALFAFQVKHPLGDAFDDFAGQVDDLIKSAANRIRDTVQKNNPKVAFGKINFNEQSPTFFKLLCPKKSPIPGAIMWAEKSQSIEPTKLTTEIFSLLSDLRNSQEQILNAAESQFKGVGTKQAVDVGTANFFRQINVNPDLLRAASFDNIQLFLEGYTPLKSDRLKEPFYKNTLFINSSEFASLIQSLQSITVSGVTKNELRNKVKDAFFALIVARLGEKEAKKRIKSITTEQLLASLSGRVNRSRGDVFDKVNIDDITNPKKVTDSDLATLITDIENRIDGLTRYQNSPTSNFPSNDVIYYWVPEDLLP